MQTEKNKPFTDPKDLEWFHSLTVIPILKCNCYLVRNKKDTTFAFIIVKHIIWLLNGFLF